MRISDWSSDVCSSDLLLHGGSVGWRLEDNHVTFNSWRQTHADAAFNAAGNCARWSRAGALPAPQGAAPDRRSDVTPQIRLHRSEEHTSELQSLMRISYAVFCLKKKKKKQHY